MVNTDLSTNITSNTELTYNRIESRVENITERGVCGHTGLVPQKEEPGIWGLWPECARHFLKGLGLLCWLAFTQTGGPDGPLGPLGEGRPPSLLGPLFAKLPEDLAGQSLDKHNPPPQKSRISEHPLPPPRPFCLGSFICKVQTTPGKGGGGSGPPGLAFT